MASTEVYILRHAQSLRSMAQPTEDPPLSSEGIRQCERVKSYIREKNLKFALGLVSPLQRTEQTLILSGIPKSMIRKDERLRELSHGIDRSLGKVQYGEVHNALAIQLNKVEEETRFAYVPELFGLDPKRYETDKAGSVKINELLQEVVPQYDGKIIIIVTSALLMRAFISSWRMQLRLQGWIKSGQSVYDLLIPGSAPVQNTGYLHLKFIEGEENPTFLEIKLAGFSN